MDMQDQLNVINNEELKHIKGGAGISGAILNYLNKALSAFTDVGRTFGSSLRRFITKKNCAL